ncbi:MAG TPA: hypothetical protein VKV96_04690 [Roseiarcus sp.]|nr:hypothetical protein [Roseiarcus sp.]
MAEEGAAVAILDIQEADGRTLCHSLRERGDESKNLCLSEINEPNLTQCFA